MIVPDPIAIALQVARVLDALGVRHTVGGSIASSFAGEPRSTVDIDIVAALGTDRRDVSPGHERRDREDGATRSKGQCKTESACAHAAMLPQTLGVVEAQGLPVRTCAQDSYGLTSMA